MPGSICITHFGNRIPIHYTRRRSSAPSPTKVAPSAHPPTPALPLSLSFTLTFRLSLNLITLVEWRYLWDIFQGCRKSVFGWKATVFNDCMRDCHGYIRVHCIPYKYMYLCRLPEYLCETIRRIVAKEISQTCRMSDKLRKHRETLCDFLWRQHALPQLFVVINAVHLHKPYIPLQHA